MLYIFAISLLYSGVPARQGWWKFDTAANVLKAETGLALELVGSHQYVPGPKPGNGAINIGMGSYYKMKHGIRPNGGGSMVNEYTLMIDFKVPGGGTWKTLFQTDMSNKSDADWFISTIENIGIQATGYTSYAIIPNEWYRFVLTVKNGAAHISYLDGQAVKAGSPLPIDGRFALDSLLLLFADNDGDDAEIECAEIAIWNSALSTEDVAALGGYGHYVGLALMPIVPYLQTPTPTSVYVCWHDTSSTGTSVEYGSTPSLGSVAIGSSELVALTNRWHTVLLRGLTPNTEYFYKVKSGEHTSEMYTMRTQPVPGYAGKIRFLLLSDTHNSDTSKSMRVITAAKKKITELYGADIHNQINAVLHSGDLVIFGRNVDEYTKLFFAPMSIVSSSIPFLTVPGNHDRPDNGRDGDAGKNYYAYMKYDSISLMRLPSLPSERFWSARFANTLIIGINTDLASSLSSVQNMLLDRALAEAQADSTIDYVLCLSHHMPYTELWGEAIGYDPGPNYVRNDILPIFRKYSKVTQLTYGHTHGYERGTVESNTNEGDFRIVCNGGGGGNIDRWGAFKNEDYQNIHISLDHYSYQIVEIDAVKKTFFASMYSLGNTDTPHDNQALDSWYRNVLQLAPSTPSVTVPQIMLDKYIFQSSPMIGPDSLMTVRLQVAYDSSFSQIAVDTMVHWKNIYGSNGQFTPVDKNTGIDLTKIRIPVSRFVQGKSFYYRVKYRDFNLRWSDWSIRSNSSTGVTKKKNLPTSYGLEQNYLNPFNPTTTITYQVPEKSFVPLTVSNVAAKKIEALQYELVNAGQHEKLWEGLGFSSSTYFYLFTALKEKKIDLSQCKQSSIVEINNLLPILTNKRRTTK
ncbi:MAG: metallophosphoesterase [Bacteroidetes bacterium]|nr:metallophosphoesterase [Bacteroidota bacterium]